MPLVGIIDNWLRNIKDTYCIYQEELETMPSEDEKFNKLVEINVKEQAFNLAKTSIVPKCLG